MKILMSSLKPGDEFRTLGEHFITLSVTERLGMPVVVGHCIHGPTTFTGQPGAQVELIRTFQGDQNESPST